MTLLLILSPKLLRVFLTLLLRGLTCTPPKLQLFAAA